LKNIIGLIILASWDYSAKTFSKSNW